MIVYKKGNVTKKTKDCTALIMRWRPIDGCLIEEQDGSFVLPTHHSEHGNCFYHSFKRATIRNVVLLLLLMLMTPVIFVVEPELQHIEVIVFFALLFAYAVIDMWLSVKSYEGCKQKAEFLFNLQTVFKKNAALFISVFASMASLQWYLSLKLGGFDALIVNYGNYYPEVDSHSYWRFLLGPLWHGDMQHGAVNATLTIIFASMIPANKHSITVALFSCGAVGSHIVVFLAQQIYPNDFDALLGASGGAYALVSYAFCCFCHKRHFNTAISLILLMVLSELSVSLLSNDASHTAHISGALIGAVIFLFKCRASPDPSVPL